MSTISCERKRIRPSHSLGRGVTAAYLTFNRLVWVRIPSAQLIAPDAARSSAVRAGPYKTQVEGSIPSAPTDTKQQRNETRDQGVSGSIPGS